MEETIYIVEEDEAGEETIKVYIEPTAREGTELTVFTDNQEARGNAVRQGYVALFLNFLFFFSLLLDSFLIL